MANYYTQCAFEIPCKDSTVTRSRMKAIEAYVRKNTPLDDSLFPNITDVQATLQEAKDNEWLGFTWAIEEDDDSLYIAHDETINLENAVAVAQLMLDLDDNSDVFYG